MSEYVEFITSQIYQNRKDIPKTTEKEEPAPLEPDTLSTPMEEVVEQSYFCLIS